MKKQMTSLMTALVLLGSTAVPALAHNNRYYDYDRYRNRPTAQGQYLQKALIGGGAGAVVGGLLGNEYNRGSSAVKGALVGAGVGLGYQYLKNQGVFSNGRRW